MSGNEPKRRGRPPKGPMQGKGYNFATRITAETRAALDAEASRTGRSLSQVAELWLEQARFLSELSRSGRGVTEGLASMARFAALVQDELGDPETSVVAREALRAGWRSISKRAVPYTIDRTDEGSERRAAEVAVKAAAKAARDGLVEAEAQQSLPQLFKHLQVIGTTSGMTAQWYSEALAVIRQWASAPELPKGLLDELLANLSPLIIASTNFERRRLEAAELAIDLAREVAPMDNAGDE